jgi:hypothetical protein
MKGAVLAMDVKDIQTPLEYISLVILHATYTKRHLNDLSVRARLDHRSRAVRPRADGYPLPHPGGLGAGRRRRPAAVRRPIYCSKISPRNLCTSKPVYYWKWPPLRGRFCGAAAADEDGGSASEAVDVAPLGGRLVIFRSR